MADADVERLALRLEPHRAAQASTFPDHDVLNRSRDRPRCRTPRRWRSAQSSGGEPGHHRGQLLHQYEALLRDLRQHEVDVLLRHLVEDRGLGRRRRHRVDQDVVRGELLAERLRQRDQAGLGGRIMRGVRIAFLAGDRGDVHDAPVLLLEHRGHDRLADDEGAVEVDAQHLVPLGEVGLPHRLVDAGDAGIVDEDVDLAEGGERRIAGLLDRRRCR